MPDHARHAPAVTISTIAPSTPEPVAIASAVQAVLVAAAALGWTYLDDARIAAIVTAVATIGTVAALLVARGRVRALRPGDPDPAAPVVADEDLVAAVAEQLRARGLSAGPGVPYRPSARP